MFSRRISAFVIDLLVASLPALLMAIVAVIMISSPSPERQFVGKYLLLLSIIPWCLFFLLISFFQVARGEDTVGRKALGLRLIRKDGEKTGPLQALLRTTVIALPVALVIFLSLSPLLLLIPALGALLDRESRAPWDIVAGTELSSAQSSERGAPRQSHPSETG